MSITWNVPTALAESAAMTSYILEPDALPNDHN